MEPNAVVSTEGGYEFDEAQNTTIKSLSRSMRWVAAVMLVIGLLQCVAGVLTITKQGLAALIQAFIMIVFAVFTYKAADAFRRIVDSEGHDITHLMAALSSLRNLYRLQVILLALAALVLIISFFMLAFVSLAR